MLDPLPPNSPFLLGLPDLKQHIRISEMLLPKLFYKNTELIVERALLGLAGQDKTKKLAQMITGRFFFIDT